jgi:hypothetical protein
MTSLLDRANCLHHRRCTAHVSEAGRQYVLVTGSPRVAGWEGKPKDGCLCIVYCVFFFLSWAKQLDDGNGRIGEESVLAAL